MVCLGFFCFKALEKIARPFYSTVPKINFKALFRATWNSSEKQQNYFIIMANCKILSKFPPGYKAGYFSSLFVLVKEAHTLFLWLWVRC